MPQVPYEVELLKSELQLLDNKINAAIGRIWQSRSLCVTLWTGTVAIGLGGTTRDHTPLLTMLWIGSILPVLFAFIDVTYHGWYFRLKWRERALIDFFNADGFVIESTKRRYSLAETLETGNVEFPIFDFYGWRTFDGNRAYFKAISIRSVLFDRVPIVIYGSLILSGLCLAIFIR